jgi:hypothetical protein
VSRVWRAWARSARSRVLTWRLSGRRQHAVCGLIKASSLQSGACQVPPRMARILEPYACCAGSSSPRGGIIVPAAPLLGFIAVSATIGSCADCDGQGLVRSVGWRWQLDSAAALARWSVVTWSRATCWQRSVTNSDVPGRRGTSIYAACLLLSVCVNVNVTRETRLLNIATMPARA